jgi:hypothetical protein
MSGSSSLPCQTAALQSKAALPLPEVRIIRSTLNSYSRRHRTKRTIVTNTSTIDAIRTGHPMNGRITQNGVPIAAPNQQAQATTDSTRGRRLQNQLARSSSWPGTVRDWISAFSRSSTGPNSSYFQGRSSYKSFQNLTRCSVHLVLGPE